VASIQALNAMIDAWDAGDEARRIGGRARTVGEFLAVEQSLLGPLPDEPFETGLWLSPRVDRFAQVMVRNNRYSVPVRLIGRRVRVLLHASDLVIYDGRTEAARHERLPGTAGARLDLDHYLEALVRKPGALPGATALEQARAAGKFTPVHDAWWAAARKAHGDAAGTRRWSRSCCCTGTWTASTSSPGSPPPCGPGRSPPTRSRWRSARPPTTPISLRRRTPRPGRRRSPR
jgi:hypothetical protein